MNSVRLWIVLLALTSFLAGTAGGMLAGTRLAPASEDGPFADYAELLTGTYDLDARQVRNLHAALELYHRDLEDLKSREMARFEPELRQMGLRYRELIRRIVLDPEDQASFDRDLGTRSPSDPLP